VPQAQDAGILPVTRSDNFAKGIRALIGTLFPAMGSSLESNGRANRSAIRLPRIRFTQ
jgi:hypothetical protein